jgi:sphingosine kinase
VKLQGGLVASDVIGVEWTKTGAMHMGLTVAYYGFMSDGE